MTLAPRFSKLALAAALAAAAGSAALADSKESYVTGFQPNPIVVASNGQSYTQLKTIGNVAAQAHIFYDTEIGGTISFWEAIPTVRSGYGNNLSIPGLDAYREAKYYQVGNRPKKVDRNEVMTIPAIKLAGAAISMCNQKADALRSQGKTNAQIFGTDQVVNFAIGVIFNVDASGAGSGNMITEVSSEFLAPVVCAKWQGARIPTTVGGLKAPIEIKKVTMKLQEVATLGGACMVKLRTEIQTTEANATLKFRYVHSSGKKSKVFSVNTGSVKVAVANHQWEIPNKAGPETGWMQLEGVSPKFHSNKAGYNMSCKSGGGTVGGLKPTPGKPKVAVPIGGSGLKSN